MPPIEVRPFRRADRDQVAALVNAHVEAVLPGVSLSVNAVLSQLEREPDEYVVDPWAVERATLVAVERDRIVAAAHLVRYGSDARVSDSYRDSAELRWVVFWPPHSQAADALLAQSLAVMAGWRVTRRYADGALPAPALYGPPDCWPHVLTALGRAGFEPGARLEVILLADVADLPRAGAAPVAGLTVAREVGDHATRFSARLGDRVAGFFELQTDLTNGGVRSRLAGWADVWELQVADDLRRQGVGRWLVGHGADWLRLARVERVLHVVVAGEDGALAAVTRLGWRELTRARRGWAHRDNSPG